MNLLFWAWIHYRWWNATNHLRFKFHYDLNMFMWIHSIQYQSTIFITNSLLRIHLDFDIICANREFTILIMKSLLIHCDYRQFALISIQTHYLYGSFSLNSLFSSSSIFVIENPLCLSQIRYDFNIFIVDSLWIHDPYTSFTVSLSRIHFPVLLYRIIVVKPMM